MDFIEYIEKVCDIKLKDYQKEFLRKYDQAKNEGKTLIINPARASRSSYLYLVGLYETAYATLYDKSAKAVIKYEHH